MTPCRASGPIPGLKGRKSMSQKDEARPLQVTREQYERLKPALLAQDGLIIDFDDNGLTISFSSRKVVKRLTRKAAKKGMDLDTYMNHILHDIRDRAVALTKERAAKHNPPD